VSLSSRLARVRGQAAPSADPTGAPGGPGAELPRRDPLDRPSQRSGRESATAADVTAALTRFVDEERPTYRVERLAALAAARTADITRATDALLPGNGEGGSIDQALLRIGGPESRRRLGDRRARIEDVPPALQFLALRAQGLSTDETLSVGSRPPVPTTGRDVVDTAPCKGCGGSTRVAMVDLVEDVATVECTRCGLRREESAAVVGY
jgi:hypothetical protein